MIPPEGRDLCYGSLVFEALWQDTSPVGRQFAKESEELYLYWRRLVKGIMKTVYRHSKDCILSAHRGE